MITALFKKSLLVATIALSLGLFSTSAFAAAPDGLGPWADSVFNASQGLEKNGNPVPAVRSDPTSALGVAENDTVDGHFYSLGFGGSIALGFDNGISSGVIIVEATNPGYPNETAKVEVSENGTTWVTAGNVTADGQVSKPDGITCAKYVRITDTSDKANFSDDTADGYDVDGVQASGDPCTPPTPTPTPTATPTPTPTPTCPQAGCGCSSITQNNSTVVLTKVVSKSNTGGNKANGNTGGSNSITTGNATSTSSVTVTGGSNVLNATPCCNNSGDTNVTISGNGAGSTNNVNINNGKSDPKKGLKLLFKKK